MTDHIKRFNLSEAQPRRSFVSAARDQPTVKTKDNAQPVIPPPRADAIPHPRLAPPGMMGSRPFAPFVHDPDKTRGLDR